MDLAKSLIVSEKNYSNQHARTYAVKRQYFAGNPCDVYLPASKDRFDTQEQSMLFNSN
jgi:hypothetical protein